jgi:hypothetical protein
LWLCWLSMTPVWLFGRHHHLTAIGNVGLLLQLLLLLLHRLGSLGRRALLLLLLLE